MTMTMTCIEQPAVLYFSKSVKIYEMYPNQVILLYANYPFFGIFPHLDWGNADEFEHKLKPKQAKKVS